MIETRNPATGEKLAEYAPLTPSKVDAKLEAAQRAFGKWRISTVEERVALLGALGDAYEENEEKLARQASLEMGKTFATSKAEVEKCVALFRHMAEAGPAMLEGETWDLGEDGSAVGVWLPLGPVLAVMPWNYPYWQVARFLAPAIMAGNVGVLKHASIVQGCAELIEDMMGEAGAPAGLFQNLAIGSDGVEQVIRDRRVRAVTLTGSEGAGQAVAKIAGEELKKVVLELGGSDPFIVMPSADLDDAVKQAVKARTQNTGQSCICGKRMIVHADVFDDFMHGFEAAMKGVVAGDPFDEATDMGPLSSEEQLETVQNQLGKAKDEGAKLLFGAQTREGPGAYMTAGVLVDVPLDSETAHEEIFGPVAQVYRAGDIDDAIRIANAIPYGLGSSVWTQDAEEEARFVRDIDAGMTAVNQMLASNPAAPFGGVKRSGHGRELTRHGMHEFMNLKTVFRPA